MSSYCCPVRKSFVIQMFILQADVFDVKSWRDQLKGAVGVSSCLGAFGSNKFMQQVCHDITCVCHSGIVHVLSYLIVSAKAK